MKRVVERAINDLADESISGESALAGRLSILLVLIKSGSLVSISGSGGVGRAMS